MVNLKLKYLTSKGVTMNKFLISLMFILISISIFSENTSTESSISINNFTENNEFAEIDELIKLNDYYGALFLLDSHLEDFPNDTNFIIKKINILLEINRVYDAFDLSKKLFEDNKTEKTYKAHLNVLSKLISIDKNYKEEYYTISKEYLEIINYNDAKFIYEVGNNYIKDNKYNSALEIFLTDKSNYYKNVFGRALMYRFLGYYDKSIEEYKYLINNYPEIKESYFGIGISYKLNGNFAEAVKNFNKYLEYNKSEEAYVAIAEIEIARNRYSSAKAILELAKKDFPLSKQIENLLIEVYSNL
ncbi:MAG: hypothetical protein PWP46_144 [Fusobacteriaceae bacterium]|nr:repeat-containing protein [Fusobacteriales bacterium]MDN5303265.1 hypothetical protein [Fusobacteriaceae bacterium]